MQHFGMVKSSEKTENYLAPWLHEALRRHNLTQTDLGRALGGSAVDGHRFFTRKHIPIPQLQVVADLLQEPVKSGPEPNDPIVYPTNNHDYNQDDTPRSISETSYGQTYPAYAPIPIYAARSINWYEMAISSDIEAMVPPPWYSNNPLVTFGFRLCAENMAPAYEDGDILIINRLLQARRNKAALFTMAQDAPPLTATIGRLLGQEAGHWIIEDLAPGDDQPIRRRLSKTDWPNAYLILGKSTA